VTKHAASLLLEARRRAGLSRAEAARRSATSRAALLAYENGAVSPTMDTAARILAVYGFTLGLEEIVELE
jgi:transcriptional regulator with XRE-family HTH domain